MSISDTPVSASPARIAAGIGVAPRWRGRSDGCRFSAPWRGRSSSAGARSGRSRPAPAGRAQARPPRRSTLGARRRSGRSMRSPCARPNRPPADRSAGRVSPAGWAPLRPPQVDVRMRRPVPRPTGTAKAPLPRKTVRRAPSRSRQRRQRLFLRALVVRRLADGDQLVHRVEVVDVQLALEMVELVLHGARQEAIGRRA